VFALHPCIKNSITGKGSTGRKAEHDTGHSEQGIENSPIDRQPWKTRIAGKEGTKILGGRGGNQSKDYYKFNVLRSEKTLRGGSKYLISETKEVGGEIGKGPGQN